MEGFWPIFFLAVILKIPVACLLYLVWWALHAEPELEEAPEDGGEHRFHRYRREPKRPRDPRRGPHAPDAVSLPTSSSTCGERTRKPSRPRTQPDRRRERT